MAPILARTNRKAGDELRDKQIELATLSPLVTRRRTWQFAKEESAFLHDSLKNLEADIPAFTRKEISFVRDRQLRWARFLRNLEQSEAYLAAWDRAIRALEDSPSYGTRPKPKFVPQRGLVPIGENPATQLWEFYHLRSAWNGESDPKEIRIPRHDEKGHLSVHDETGIVFVLMPRRKFWLGAQSSDPAGHNYDPQAKGHEGPPQEAMLPCFFIARHELTQGQWARLAALDEELRPSRYLAGASNAIGERSPMRTLWRTSPGLCASVSSIAGGSNSPPRSSGSSHVELAPILRGGPAGLGTL
jgi:hypothetical protein